jgi:hypothetical protein
VLTGDDSWAKISRRVVVVSHRLTRAAETLLGFDSRSSTSSRPFAPSTATAAFRNSPQRRSATSPMTIRLPRADDSDFTGADAPKGDES